MNGLTPLFEKPKDFPVSKAKPPKNEPYNHRVIVVVIPETVIVVYFVPPE